MKYCFLSFKQDNEVNHVNIIEMNGWFQFGNDGQPFRSLLGLINFLISDKMIIRPLPGKEKYRRKALEIWKHDRGRKTFCNLCLCFQRSIHYYHFFKMFVNKIESEFRLLGGKTFDSVCRKAGYHEMIY